MQISSKEETTPAEKNVAEVFRVLGVFGDSLLEKSRTEHFTINFCPFFSPFRNFS